MELFIPGPAGRLEAILWLPGEREGDAREPSAAAVVCHPHPLHGGTMRSNVVFRIARGLQSAGLAALRFNFRGAGRSEGRHDGHGGEEGEAAAALDQLAERFPGLPLWGAGFSFGARTIAGLALREPRLERLALVALPCRAYDCSLVRDVRQPALLLFAGADEFGNLAELRERLGELPPNLELDEIPGVDHLFRGATPELESRVRAWAERSLKVPR